jgi:hypothetical protein
MGMLSITVPPKTFFLNTMYPYKYDLDLRIWHPSMNPDVIIHNLKLKPIAAWMSGTPRITPKGEPLSGLNKQSYCCFELIPPKKADLTECLDKWTGKLQSHRALFKKINNTGGKVEYHVGFYASKNSGEVLDWPLLKFIGDHGINLYMDYYPFEMKD